MASNSKRTTRKSTPTQTSREDVILNGVLAVLDKKTTWIGTMTDLQTDLVRVLGKKTTLPRSPSALRVVLNRVVNRLRIRGVSVRFSRSTDHSRTRYVKFITR
jgi:hypothetical protein